MRISAEIEQQLNHIARNPAAGLSELTVMLPQGILRCQVAACDAIGCSVLQVKLGLTEAQHWPLENMRTLAEHLCRQLRYLVEPLQVIEVDNEQPLVQARSQPPSRDQQRNSTYYELLVSPHALSLVRFSAPRHESRQTVAMQLTREILTRLLQDIADAVSQKN